jgi:peptidyl-dipeptidase A
MQRVYRSRLAAVVCGVSALFSAVSAAADDKEEMAAMARQLIAEHEKTLRPLEIEIGKMWWEANTTGSDESYKAKQEAETRFDLALADEDRFARIKKCHEAGLTDKTLARQIHVLYLQALAKQVDPELLKNLIARANAIEQAFNVYRGKVKDKEVADSEVRKVLKESTDGRERQAYWEASKGVGAVVQQDLASLVRLRNQSARELGFPDYHAMQLALNEQSQADVIRLFDDLDALTREPFLQLKDEIDTWLASKFAVRKAELRPWHYQDPFFQEAPAIYPVSLDSAYSKLDVLELCRKFYKGIDLPIDDVLARSDLYEKPGKSPHAFCTDIDREGDVRVLANIVPNEYWMGTMLHELGHAVYSSKNIPRDVPYVLRSDAHILATEGVAMMFERFSKSADWLAEMGVKVDDSKAFNETGARMRKARLLVFSRWCQVMLRFEKEMYRDPDQDLNRLWWDLVEKYQGVKRPEGRDAPDYAAKIHVVSAPAYYHNYMMGELFACQVHRTIVKEVLGKSADVGSATYSGRPEVGRFMRERVFSQGRLLPWNDLTRFATGEPLSPEAFAAEFSGN